MANGALTTITTYIEPTYIKKAPTNDGWNNPMNWEGDAATGSAYSIISAGKGGVFNGFVGGPTQDFTADIYFSVGSFTQWPEGVQK